MATALAAAITPSGASRDEVGATLGVSCRDSARPKRVYRKNGEGAKVAQMEEHQKDCDLTDVQKRELERRLAAYEANPDDVIPRETIRQNLRAKSEALGQSSAQGE